MAPEVKDKKPITPKLEGVPHRIVCFGCSLLCDDVFVEIDKDKNGSGNEKLIRTINSCFRGDNYLRSFKGEGRLESPMQKKMGLQMNLTIEEGIEILNSEIIKAKNINFYGLGALSYDQQIDTMVLIKKLLGQGKSINIRNCNKTLLNATKFGFPLASVGQGINNADVFLFWNTDPTHSHPKIIGKLAFTRGLFRSSGKEVKKIILIEEAESDLTHISDIIINDKGIKPKEFLESLSNLLENDKINNVGSGEFNDLDLKHLKTYIKETEYGFLITSIPLESTESIEKLNDIGKMLNILNKNAKGRYSLMPLSLMSNDMGLSMALLSMFSKEELLSLIDDGIQDGKNLDPNRDVSQELGIVFGGPYLRDDYIEEKLEYNENKLILFDNFQSETSKYSMITIPYAVSGIECDGISIRMDSLNVNLKKWSVPISEDIITLKEIFLGLKFE